MINQLFGNKDNFAIEYGISKAYKQIGLRALGYFVIYINGKLYGIKSNDATCLANSYNTIIERLEMKGKHKTTFSNETNPETIANAMIYAIYSPIEKTIFPEINVKDELYTNKIIWAPDGDEAFDDGSFVLQFDIDNNVRIIGFRFNSDYECEKDSISETWIDQNAYYKILTEWRISFDNEWNKLEKE